MNNNDQKLWTFHQTDNVDNLLIGHPRQEMLFKKISRLVERGGDVLEIGFGDGFLLEKLSDRYECSGADISDENISQMKKKLPSVNFSLIGVDGRLPYEDGHFDAFVASEVLEHMSNDELVLCVSEIKRVLKSDGYAFITVPAKENLKDNECFCPNCGEKFHKWGHKQVWNDLSIRSVFSDFEIRQLKEFFVPYQGNGFMERSVGYIMYAIRNILNLFMEIGGKSYFILLKNNK